MGSVKKEVGFTLIELLVTIAVISLLAAIAISHYQSYRVRAFDIAAKSDLKNATTVLETYLLENDIYPANYSDLLANGFNFSKNVCFTKYDLENGGEHVHMHISIFQVRLGSSIIGPNPVTLVLTNGYGSQDGDDTDDHQNLYQSKTNLFLYAPQYLNSFVDHDPLP